MTLNDLKCAIFKVTDSKCHKNGEIQLSNHSDQSVANYRVAGFLDALHVRRTYSCARALTYILTQLGTYKTGNISETAEDRAKATSGVTRVSCARGQKQQSAPPPGRATDVVTWSQYP